MQFFKNFQAESGFPVLYACVERSHNRSFPAPFESREVFTSENNQCETQSLVHRHFGRPSVFRTSPKLHAQWHRLDTCLLEALFDPLLTGRISDQCTLAAQDNFECVDNLNETASCALLLGEFGSTEICVSTTLKDGVYLAVEGHGLQMKVWDVLVLVKEAEYRQ